ncbi:MAG: oligosaccharide flippase family protein [Phycisphaeraceae bacterium]
MSSQPSSSPTADMASAPAAEPPAQPMADAQHGSLRSRAKRGTAIFAVSQIIGQLMRLGSNLLLTRLLVPEHFGIMALVNIYISGINMFSDLGIRQSIVQNKLGDDQRFLNTAWTVQVIRGFAVWLIACILAFPIAYGVYDLPILAQLLPVAALASVALGFQSTKASTASRHLLLGREMSIQLGCNVIGIAVMAAIAYYYQTVWSLVIGGVVNATLKSALTHVVFPGPNNRFAWDRESLGELIRFGKWVFMGTVVVFVANNVDRLALSKLITTEMLGIYQIAFMLSNLPSMLIKRFGNDVVFPIVSRQAEQSRESIRQKLLKNQRKLALLMSMPVLLLVCGGDVVVELLWDDRYREAGWMTSILGLGMWIGMLYSTSQPALMALGKPQYGMFLNLARVIWVGLVAWAGFHYFGLIGFLVAFGLSELPAYLVVAYATTREKIAMWRQDVWMTALMLLAVGAVVMIRYSLTGDIPFLPDSERFGMLGV